MSFRPKLPTVQVTTPDSAIQVTLKTVQTYGDSKAIYQSVLGSTPLNVDAEAAAPRPTITLAQAQEMIGTTLERMIAGWDLTEDDGTAIPVTKEAIESVLTDGDVNFLMAQIKPADPKKA